MSDLIWAAAAITIATVLSVTALRGWRGWLELRRHQIDSMIEPDPSSSVRIEVAAVKERLRKLEAIARGVDP